MTGQQSKSQQCREQGSRLNRLKVRRFGIYMVINGQCCWLVAAESWSPIRCMYVAQILLTLIVVFLQETQATLLGLLRLGQGR